MKWKRYLPGIFCLILLLGADQLTKYLAAACLKEKAPVSIIKDIFELQYLENRGAAFGVMQGQRWLLLGITLLTIAVLVFFYLKLPFTKHYLPLRFTGILVGAGAVGNMIDRFFLGYVVDFFYFKLIDFPIFNLADCYVVVAAVLGFLLIGFYYKDDDFAFLRKKQNESDNSENAG